MSKYISKSYLNYSFSFQDDEKENTLDDSISEKYKAFMGMLLESGTDNSLLKRDPVKKRKRYKKFKTANDYYTKGFEDTSSSEERDREEYSNIYRCRVPKSRELIPTRVMTEALSRQNHADVPHRWLCSGKLLVLEDPKHPNNTALFQVSLSLILSQQKC